MSDGETQPIVEAVEEVKKPDKPDKKLKQHQQLAEARIKKAQKKRNRRKSAKLTKSGWGNLKNDWLSLRLRKEADSSDTEPDEPPKKQVVTKQPLEEDEDSAPSFADEIKKWHLWVRLA